MTDMLTRPTQTRQIYALTDIAPETQAYALARYSRSAASLRESVAWITSQKAADFLETFYFAYGHKSIADMAHVTLALENISVLAAIEIEDEPLWDGQERSTRYQDFSKSRYVVPPELETGDAAQTFAEVADGLFGAYTSLTKEVLTVLMEVLPRPDGLEAGNYKRTLQARALDVTRTLLPYATRTSLGQITSARVLERQLARLFASPYAELRAIAAEMKTACQETAFSPLAVRLEASLQGLSKQHPEAATVLSELAATLEPTSPAPTLVKYAEPSPQSDRVAASLGQIVREYLSDLTPDTSATVRLVENDPPLLEAVSSLLYRWSDLAYHQIQAVVRDMTPSLREEIYDLAQSARGRHDGWLREQQSGYGRIYDLLLDAKSMQDFFRHRRCVQVRQAITARHGFVAGQEWFELGLPPRAVAQAGPAIEQYDRILSQVVPRLQPLTALSPQATHYGLPLGYRRRALFKMDEAQAAYIIETRSAKLGHFAYRAAACAMWRELNRVEPGTAKWVRVTPFELEETDYLTR